MIVPNEPVALIGAKPKKQIKLEESLVVTHERANYIPVLLTERSPDKTVSPPPVTVPVIIIPESVPFAPRSTGDQLPPKTPSSHRKNQTTNAGIPI